MTAGPTNAGATAAEAFVILRQSAMTVQSLLLASLFVLAGSPSYNFLQVIFR